MAVKDPSAHPVCAGEAGEAAWYNGDPPFCPQQQLAGQGGRLPSRVPTGRIRGRLVTAPGRSPGTWDTPHQAACRANRGVPDRQGGEAGGRFLVKW
jgi:hypothetical protein